MAKKTVCVDLDGVLAQYTSYKGVDHFDDPFPGAREFLAGLRKIAKVTIFTTRASESAHGDEFPSEALEAKVAAWLKRWNLPYDEIWTGAGKPIASAYVDDRAVPCEPDRSRRFPDVGYNYVLTRCRQLVGAGGDNGAEEK
jgi:hypothetical protein